MSERRRVIKNGIHYGYCIRKFFWPLRPKTASSRTEQAEEQATAEKELAASEPLLATSDTQVQAEPEQADYSAKPSDNDRRPLPSLGPSCSGLSKTQGHGGPPDDLGEDKPAQVILNKFPSRLFKGHKRVLTDDRLSMLHQRNAHLVQLAFERDLTKRFATEWKGAVMKRFNSGGADCSSTKWWVV